jgi:DNA repair exonuclease SbcCD ATPase subunit
MNKPLFLLLSILFFSACEPNDSANYSEGLAFEAPMEEFAPRNESMKVSSDAMAGRSMVASFADDNPIDTKIITSANLNMEVENLEKFEAELKTLLSQFKANVSNQNRNDYDRRLESNFTIRVPSSSFDELFEALKPLAKRIENQSLNLQDVTEQFIDVESRIKNRKVLEERYRELLKQAKNVNDILTIERQLNQIRSEIESQEGRLKYLNDQVDMSTIQLNAFEIKPFVYQPEPTDSFGQQILKSLSDGWSGLIHGIIWIISLWPFALVIGFILFLFKRRRKA